MGYDIYTVEKNKELAEKFGREYGYNYMFNVKVSIESLTGEEDVVIPADAEYEGDGSVYFRANIWGMSELRDWIRHVADTNPENFNKYDNLIMKISYNDGDIITPEEIEMLLSDAGRIDNSKMDAIYEKLDGKPRLLDEWIDFLMVARNLGGAQVY